MCRLVLSRQAALGQPWFKLRFPSIDGFQSIVLKRGWILLQEFIASFFYHNLSLSSKLSGNASVTKAAVTFLRDYSTPYGLGSRHCPLCQEEEDSETFQFLSALLPCRFKTEEDVSGWEMPCSSLHLSLFPMVADNAPSQG